MHFFHVALPYKLVDANFVFHQVVVSESTLTFFAKVEAWACWYNMLENKAAQGDGGPEKKKTQAAVLLFVSTYSTQSFYTVLFSSVIFFQCYQS